MFQAKQVTGGDSLAASVVSLHCAPSGFSEPLSFYIKSLSTEIRGFTSLDRFGRVSRSYTSTQEFLSGTEVIQSSR